MEDSDQTISSAKYDILKVGLWIALFLLIASFYASQLGLWGDEAFSLDRAARSWSGILAVEDTHLPTYYLLLHPLLALTGKGADAELTLRILHAVCFSVGLLFCWLILRNLRLRPLLTGVMMLNTIMLPNYIFYATNLRMYTPLFALSMSFCWQALRLLAKPQWVYQDVILLCLAGIAVIILDYPGLFLVVTVGLFLVIERFGLLRKPGKLLLWLTLLCVVLAILVLRNGLGAYADWPVLRAMALPEASPRALAKLIFFSIRPILDIVYPPVYPVWINILLWVILLLAFAISIRVLWRWGGSRERLIVILALYWLLATPLGVSFTRFFLPAQFFAMLTMVLVLERAMLQNRLVIATVLSLSLFATGLANLQQVLSPSVRIYSRIPYQEVAKDAVELATARNLDTIVVSRHTLNALSIERYLRPQLQAGQQMRFLKAKPSCASYPEGEFLYVQLMPEDGESSDPRVLCKDRGNLQVEDIKQYVPFEELGYNQLWRSSLRDKADGAGYGVRIAAVGVGSP